MAGSLNRVELIGNLGRDPEIRSTQDGRRIATLNIATSESWTDKVSGQKKEATEWMTVVIFNEGLAKVAEEYLLKGHKVYVSGQFKTRKWTDKKGVDHWTTEVVLQQYRGELILLQGQSSRPPAASGPEDYGLPDRGPARGDEGRPSRHDGQDRRDAFDGPPDQPPRRQANLDDDIPF